MIVCMKLIRWNAVVQKEGRISETALHSDVTTNIASPICSSLMRNHVNNDGLFFAVGSIHPLFRMSKFLAVVGIGDFYSPAYVQPAFSAVHNTLQGSKSTDTVIQY